MPLSFPEAAKVFPEGWHRSLHLVKPRVSSSALDSPVPLQSRNSTGLLLSRPARYQDRYNFHRNPPVTLHVGCEMSKRLTAIRLG